MICECGVAGAEYEPVLYVCNQIVNGINYCFLAVQMLVTDGQNRYKICSARRISLCIAKNLPKIAVKPLTLVRGI